MQSGCAAKQRFRRNANARADNSPDVLALRRDTIESRGGAEVHRDAGPSVLFKSRNRVHDAVRTHFGRIVVEHRHAGLYARLDEQRFAIEIALANLAQNGIQRRDDGRNHDTANAGNLDRVHGEQVAKKDSVLVDGLGLDGGDTPVRYQPLIAGGVKDSENRVGVSDIENEKHGKDASVARYRYFGLTDPLSTVRTPCAVRTCRKPRGSSPSVMPSKPPFSST